MRNGARVSVIIPALNEAPSIGKVLDAIPDWVDQIVVADNGSTDGTGAVAAQHGARVVRESRRGYGSACLKGIAALDRPDVVVFLDADFSDHPDQMDRLVDPILAGTVDIVIGSRVLGNADPGALTPQSRFGNRLACFLMRLFWKASFTDLGPFRAIRYQTLKQIGMRDPDYGWTVEMQIKAALYGIPCTEVPVDYRKRIGRSKVSGTVRGVVGAGYKILGLIFLSAARYHLGGRRYATQSQRLIVFTRYPDPGETKTRLIPALGAEGAATLQRRMTEHCVRQAHRYGSAELNVHFTGAGSDAMREWLGASIHYTEQASGDLGDRMAAAFAQAFDDEIERAIIIGIDSPDIGPETHEAAFRALRSHDVVFGPATDGGYYLVGMRRSAAPRALTELFENIDWGTEHVLEQSESRANQLGLSVSFLAPLDDVDREEDLPTWERNTEDYDAPYLSVIVPTLNEQDRLARALNSIGDDPRVEVLVVDGGSDDHTIQIAEAACARVVQGPSGRARQMNLGSAKANGEVLMFLHADTALPPHYLDDIRQILSRPRTVAGAFRFSTDLTSFAMRVVTISTNLRSRCLRLPYGDQAIFITKEAFRRAGGYRPLPLMEDFDFVRRLKRIGRIEIAPSSIQTCARRWRRLGVWRTMLRNQIIVLRFTCGVSPEKLAAYYRRGPS